MSQENNPGKTKSIRTAHIITVVSISMVLVMLGLQGLLYINLRAASSENESYTMTLFFKDSIDGNVSLEFKKSLEKISEIKQVRFTSKEQAAEDFQEELGEDFVDFLGYNPMPPSVTVVFKPEFAGEAMLKEYEKRWEGNPIIEKVDYPRKLILALTENIKTLGWIFLSMSILLALIAITLINNTIRISIHANRFLIKTMQMAGATKAFIRRPFLLTGIYQGIFGGVLALLILTGLLGLAENKIPGIKEMRDLVFLGLLAVSLLITGIFLSFICTFFAVRKYLHLKTDSLY